MRLLSFLSLVESHLQSSASATTAWSRRVNYHTQIATLWHHESGPHLTVSGRTSPDGRDAISVAWHAPDGTPVHRHTHFCRTSTEWMLAARLTAAQQPAADFEPAVATA